MHAQYPRTLCDRATLLRSYLGSPTATFSNNCVVLKGLAIPTFHQQSINQFHQMSPPLQHSSLLRLETESIHGRGAL
jgi:hypothetical protein